MRNTLLVILLLLSTTAATAQDTVEMADVMRSNGKIYAVVAVCVTILVGLLLYVWRTDRRITALEKRK